MVIKTRNNNIDIYDSHHSSTTKYYNTLLILLIAIPLGIGCFISLKGPLLFTLTMFLSCIPIAIIITYLAIISSKLKYELSPNELKITFGIFNKKIPYNQITNIEKTQTTLILKLFGAAMPGLYWGLFKTSIGNVQAYCTKITGEDYLVLTLSDNQKIIISPKNPQQLLNTLNQQKPPSNTIPYQTNKTKPQKQPTNKIIYTQISTVAIAYSIFLSYFILTYTTLPQIIPMNFDFNGTITRWADKTELIWIAILPIIFPIINTTIALKFGKYTQNLLIILGITFIAIITIFALIIHTITITA